MNGPASNVFFLYITYLRVYCIFSTVVYICILYSHICKEFCVYCTLNVVQFVHSLCIVLLYIVDLNTLHTGIVRVLYILLYNIRYVYGSSLIVPCTLYSMYCIR